MSYPPQSYYLRPIEPCETKALVPQFCKWRSRARPRRTPGRRDTRYSKGKKVLCQLPPILPPPFISFLPPEPSHCLYTVRSHFENRGSYSSTPRPISFLLSTPSAVTSDYNDYSRSRGCPDSGRARARRIILQVFQ